MDKIIQVETKERYGKEHFYVVSSHKESIQALTGRISVTRSDIKALRDIGFSFDVVTSVKL